MRAAPHSARNHSCGSRNPSPLPLYMPAPLPVRMVRQAHHERALSFRSPPYPELVEGRERSGPLLSQGWSWGVRRGAHGAWGRAPLSATIPAKAGIHPPLPLYMPAPLPVRMVRQLNRHSCPLSLSKGREECIHPLMGRVGGPAPFPPTSHRLSCEACPRGNGKQESIPFRGHDDAPTVIPAPEQESIPPTPIPKFPPITRN